MHRCAELVSSERCRLSYLGGLDCIVIGIAVTGIAVTGIAVTGIAGTGIAVTGSAVTGIAIRLQHCAVLRLDEPWPCLGREMPIAPIAAFFDMPHSSDCRQAFFFQPFGMLYCCCLLVIGCVCGMPEMRRTARLRKKENNNNNIVSRYHQQNIMIYSYKI